MLDALEAPTLRQHTLLIRTLRQALPATMTLDSVTTYIKDNRIFIGVENAVVAQQWIFIKKKILETLKEKLPNIKEIRVQVEPQDMYLTQPALKVVCQQCGSQQLAAGQQSCSFCKSQALDVERERVYQLLREASWIRYDELDERDRKLIDYEAFMRERTFQLKRIHDRIDTEYWVWQRTKDPQNLNTIKTSIEEYVITKLNIQPQHLTNDSIKSQVSARWFKLYAPKTGQAKET
mgnify:CR=1 FL=1